MVTKCNSFKEFFENNDIETYREVETAVHKDENIANNRLFVWNFEEVDLEEFLEYFRIFKNSTSNLSTRQQLNTKLMRKMNLMSREGYNPIECMLYASKTINIKLQNDRELREILAERIKDIYIKQDTETEAVLKNIIGIWPWVPQIKVVITAIGLIGDNSELLDSILLNYGEDQIYKLEVFHALMQNKNQNNLERIMKIIMNLQDTDEDIKIKNVFKKGINRFGYEGFKMIEKYYENPGMSKMGRKILTDIMLKNDNFIDNNNEKLYRKNLASKSEKDDSAFKEFWDDCNSNCNQDALYLARFSRAEMGEFLKTALERKNLGYRERNTAIISMALIYLKGYTPAEAILNVCEKKGNNDYAICVAEVIMGKENYATKLIDTFCEKKDYELSELYGILKSSGIINYRDSIELIQEEIEKRFQTLLEEEEYNQLDCLTSNLQMFWKQKMYALISKNMLEKIKNVLIIYSDNTIPVPQGIIISLIEIITPSWNSGVERVLFALYKKSNNQKIQELSYKKLKEREFAPPK